MIEWNVSPEIFTIGSFSPRWYGVLFAFAFYLSHRLTRWQFTREGYDGAQADRLLLYMMVGTILGARLGHCLLYEPDIYLADPLRILKIWEGGLASHGALVGILTGLVLFRRGYPAISLIGLFDRLCIWVAMSGVFIRLGNLMNSEIVGLPTDVPWAFRFMRLDGVPRHPAQLYEALAYLGIFIVLLGLYHRPTLVKRPGYLFGWHMVLIFGSRFFIEFFKERHAAFEMDLPLDMGQILSIPYVSIGAYLIWRSSRVASRANVARAMLLLAPLSVSISTPAYARWASEADIEHAIEYQNITYDIRRDGTYTMTVEEEVSILKDSARRERGIVRLRYNSRASSLKILSAETLIGKRVVSVDPAMIEDKPLASSATGFDQVNQVMIVFPEIEIGAKTRLRYYREVKEVPHPGQFSESFVYGWYELEKGGKASLTSDLPLHVERHDPQGHLAVRESRSGGRHRVEIQLKKPAFRKVVDEKHALQHPDVSPRVYISTAKEWNTLGDSVAPAYERLLAEPLPGFFKKIADSAKSKSSTVERIDYITSSLAEKMHYLGDWRPIRGGHIPRSLETIAQTRYGDCKDYSLSIVAMLRRIGIEANVAWIYRDARPFIASMKTPRDSLFNHAVVRAHADGREYWLDGTNSQSWASGIPSDIAGRPALLIRPGASALVHTPDVKATDGLSHARVKTRLGSRDEVRTEGSLALHGRPALAFAGLSLTTSADTIRFNLARTVAGDSPLKSWSVTHPDLTSRIVRDLEFKFSLVARSYELKTSAGPAYPLDPPPVIPALLDDVSQRESLLWLGDPYRYRKEIVLPGIARVGDHPIDCTIDSPWVRVSRAFESLAGDGVRVIEEVELKQNHIRVDELRSKPFAKHQDELRRCFGQVALVYSLAR